MTGIAGEPLHGVFIRAPAITESGPAVEVLARLDDGRIVACRQGRLLATAFHPELTGDRRVHRAFIAMVAAALGERGQPPSAAASRRATGAPAEASP